MTLRGLFAARAGVASALALASTSACHRKLDDITVVEDAGASVPTTRPATSVAANGIPVPRASVEALVNPGNLPPYNGPTGSVEGTITIRGDHPPDVFDARKFAKCPAGASTYQKLFREGAEDKDGNRPLADAIIAITGYQGFYLPERDEAKSIRIENCAYPRAVSVTIGQRLEVTNAAKDMWAPAIEQGALPALMIATPNSDPVRLYPPMPGHLVLLDRLSHGYARSDLWVLMQPLHTISDANGHFRIDGVPIGKLEVHGRVANVQGLAEKPVEVLAGVVQKVDLNLTYTNSAPAVVAPIDAGLPATVH